MNAPIPLSTQKSRFASVSDDPLVLADIYNEDINIAVWQRPLQSKLSRAIDLLLAKNPGFQLSMAINSQNVESTLQEHFSHILKDVEPRTALIDDISYIADMFCSLFELSTVGLRMTALDQAMCPKFHVDRIPARLVTTYTGIATEWLPHQCVNRSKLGVGGKGIADHLSGLYQSDQDIQRLNTADVALLKGELWEGNEQAGLVHRSPSLKAEEHRLLLTLDFMA